MRPPPAEEIGLIALTPSERRGALVVVLLLGLGSLHDLWNAARPRIAPAVPPDHREMAVESRVSAGKPEPVPDIGRALDLNLATAADLDRLPGIGPVLAGRIVAYRRGHGGFHRVEELLGVTGIGPKLMERLRGRVQVGRRAGE